jgi:hypothetical protein
MRTLGWLVVGGWGQKTYTRTHYSGLRKNIVVECVPSPGGVFRVVAGTRGRHLRRGGPGPGAPLDGGRALEIFLNFSFVPVVSPFLFRLNFSFRVGGGFG